MNFHVAMDLAFRCATREDSKHTPKSFSHLLGVLLTSTTGIIVVLPSYPPPALEITDMGALSIPVQVLE